MGDHPDTCSKCGDDRCPGAWGSACIRVVRRVALENSDHARVQTSPFPPKPAVSEQAYALEVQLKEANARRGRLAAAHARLIERLDELQRQLDEALVDRDAAQHERDRLLTRVEELQRQLELARQVEADLRKELERNEARTELQRWKDAHASLANDLRNALNERDEARQLVANCKTRMRDLEQRVEAAEKVTNELRSRAQAARQKMLMGLNALLHDVEFDEVF